MAEIKIEKKKPIWPWIILIGLIVIALIWYFFVREAHNRVTERSIIKEEVVTKEYVPLEMNSAFDIYSAYIADTSQMGIYHTYSKGALNRLIDAVEEKTDLLNVGLNVNLEEAREKASQITEEPNSLNHADLIKESGEIIARALTELQVANYPNFTADAANVNAAVNKIDASVNTLNQKDKLNNFFKSAETLLSKMQ